MLYALFIKYNMNLLKISPPLLLPTPNRRTEHKTLPEGVKTWPLNFPEEAKLLSFNSFFNLCQTANRYISLNYFPPLVLFPLLRFHICSFKHTVLLANGCD